MPEKDSRHLDLAVQYLPFLFAVLLSSVGGAVSYLNKIDRKGVKFSFFRFCVEILTSAFVGIVSFMLCDAAELDWSYTAAIVAISGHMGARALFLIENVIFSNFLRRYGYGINQDDGEAKIGGKEQADYKAKKSA